ncbi:AAA family ATPase [Fodinisporobacter ferrooxydans]|uniref:AAA family ATPase n=1 Tax=Fodinisporobacter ferrooxydans TaxID=2901836 RepID=A0ABY4CM17_9BACL|nr:AAA family ATPase [Alicyclobacillaceae bacterium MYW30-H2]UOF90078.1 AAA family ATPase [Alicyclobacillaceae bacterium MYW30-H2]UOF90813.1 AAA family ATPase [Alicyclobacillaceae bacterium MYW30-H2]UOF91037.1 AAA family ATPase [Alicyclobacillaceae bacterium MYW30-H2]UOF91463.1 AAA family ATPase [Alicyclobacillaceae bacterium MYW30-H2]
MIMAFYSLSKIPFAKETKGMSPYTSRSFQEAMGCLTYMKQVRGMALVVGDPGAGKTYALGAFAEGLGQSLYKVIYFPLSTGTVTDFYRGLAFGLGEQPQSRKVDLFRQIQQAISRLFYEQKITPVFILDEMQMAKDVFLQDLSLLFNFHMDTQNPFVLLICGWPYLRDRLSLNPHRSLSQRLLVRHQVEPLDKEEVKGYMEHHLAYAGAKYPIFTEDAIEAVSACSNGYPRLINLLAMHALLYGSQNKKEQIDAEVIRIIAPECGLALR